MMILTWARAALFFDVQSVEVPQIFCPILVQFDYILVLLAIDRFVIFHTPLILNDLEREFFLSIHRLDFHRVESV